MNAGWPVEHCRGSDEEFRAAGANQTLALDFVENARTNGKSTAYIQGTSGVIKVESNQLGTAYDGITITMEMDFRRGYEFRREVADNIHRQGLDTDIQALSRIWVREMAPVSSFRSSSRRARSEPNTRTASCNRTSPKTEPRSNG